MPSERFDDSQHTARVQDCACQTDFDDSEYHADSEGSSMVMLNDYRRLRKFFALTNQWLPFSNFVYVRSHFMKELNVTWVFDDEVDAYRRFGSMADWQCVLDHMEDFHSGFVLVNVSSEKALLLCPRRRSVKVGLLAALEHLLEEPTAVGYMFRGARDDVEIVYIEVATSADPSDLTMPRKRFLRRDKLQMALIRLYRRVVTWWP